jgi:histone-lysine N-methyltransferase SETMAR
MRRLQQDADRLRKRFKRVQPHKYPREILIQRDGSRSHTNLKNREAITKFCWTLLPNPLYSPDIAFSDFHLFGALKNAVRSTRFETDNVICAVGTWLRELGTDNACPLVPR